MEEYCRRIDSLVSDLKEKAGLTKDCKIKAVVSYPINAHKGNVVYLHIITVMNFILNETEMILHIFMLFMDAKCK